MQNTLGFVHIEKTAGISINQILRDSFGVRHCDIELLYKEPTPDFREEIRFARAVHPRLRSIASHWLTPSAADSDNLLLFAFLRDPIERTLSHYQYQVQKLGKSQKFEDWIKVEKYRDFQTKKIAGSADFERAVQLIRERFLFVGITEHFHDSLARLNELLDGQLRISDVQGNIARSNKTKQEIRDNDELIALVHDANQIDKQLYEHVLGEYTQRPVGDANAARNTRSGVNLWLNRIYRNIVYKPLVRVARIARS